MGISRDVAFAEVGARTNFTLLDGASHPAEMVATAAALGHAGIGVCDTNSLAGVVRAHVAAKDVGLRFVVGTRLVLDDGASYLAWPTDRASYGRLTRLLSLGRMRAPKGQCQTPPSRDARSRGRLGDGRHPPLPCRMPAFAARLKIDARDLQDRLAMPLLCSAPVIYDGADRHRWRRCMSHDDCGGRRPAGHDRSSLSPSRSSPPRGCADGDPARRAGRSHRLLRRPQWRALPQEREEMGRLFAAYPEALENSIRVLEAGSGFSLDQLRHEYPDEILEPGRPPLATLTDRVHDAAARRWPDGVPDDIQKRIAHELR